MRYVVINRMIFPVDTNDGVATAKNALTSAGIAQAIIYTTTNTVEFLAQNADVGVFTDGEILFAG